MSLLIWRLPEKFKLLTDLIAKGQHKLEEFQARILSGQAVYHYHIRKTGGTSLNFAFIRVAAGNDVSAIYDQLAEKSNHRLIHNNYVLVGWNKTLIEKGNYHYAFSHMPAHSLNIPDRVKKITCFRDPVKRVVSHYNMLRHYELEKIEHPCMAVEGHWIKNGFRGFVEEMDRSAFMAQLYMFSSEFSVDQAIDFMRDRDVNFLFTENLTADLSALATQLNLNLRLGDREKQYGYKEEISESDLVLAKQMLKPEYDLIELAKKLKSL